MVILSLRKNLLRPIFYYARSSITSDLLLRLVSSYSYTRKLTLYSSRTLALCLVSFAGFLRFDEISNLKCHDVEIKKEYMLIFIESSKTDQYRDGAWLPISRTNNSTCPVANLEKYSELAEITFEEPSHLFRGITFKKGRNILNSSCLKYSRDRELVKEAFAEFIDPNIIGVHVPTQVGTLTQVVTSVHLGRPRGGRGHFGHFHTGTCRLGAQTQPCLKFFVTRKYYPV